MLTVATFTLYIVLVVVFALLLVRLVKSLKTFKIRKHYTAALEAPSVSICIPARNEMHALAECLERVLASTFPKLEIIVLDDNSKDDTSIIIKSFAHAGVRFISGSPLPEDWLGKNYALDTLAREASGTYVIFMDVDTIIKPTTVSELVGYAMTENVDMVSVLPRRNDTTRASVFFGTLRYFWQLVSHSGSRAAASSSLWLVRRDTLLDRFHGIRDYKDAVEPEVNIATALGSQYACLISDVDLGVSYEKKWSSQVETSKRLLYPLVGQHVWGGFLGILFLALLNAPTFLVLYALIFNWNVSGFIAIGILALFIFLYGLYLKYMWRNNWWAGALLWPVIIFQELLLFILSMYGYARKTVTWKNRPIQSSSEVS